MIFSTSGVNRSRTTLDAVSRSSYTIAGAFSLSAILLTLFQLFNRELKSLTLYTKYPGFYSILFQKALSAWWCGLCDESIKIFKDLNDNYDLNDRYTDLVKNNLKSKVSLLKNG